MYVYMSFFQEEIVMTFFELRKESPTIQGQLVCCFKSETDVSNECSVASTTQRNVIRSLKHEQKIEFKTTVKDNKTRLRVFNGAVKMTPSTTPSASAQIENRTTMTS